MGVLRRQSAIRLVVMILRKLGAKNKWKISVTVEVGAAWSHARDLRDARQIPSNSTGLESRQMALHPDFPDLPYAILEPAMRWVPADEALRASSAEKLMPPSVPQLRRAVQKWRNSGLCGRSRH